METVQGKHFSIPDPQGIKTVIYQVNETKKEYLDEYPKYTVERLDHTEEIEYKDFQYTPNLKRPVTIIDPETTEEIKPVLYFDEKANDVKGKCKLKPYKSYFAFEIREDK